MKSISLPGLFSLFQSAPAAKCVKKSYVIRESGSANFWLGGALLALNAVLLLGYLSGVNSRSLQGYELKQLQTRVSSLAEENKKLDLKITEASSVLVLQNDFARADFVAMGTPRFLEVESDKYSYNNRHN